MDFEIIIGLTAAACTTFAFLPQVIKVVKTKETRNISLGMYFIFTVGILLWLIYGVLLNNFPMILANIISFVFASIVLILKIRYR